MIAKEVETALQNISKKHQTLITEFTVAPQINPKQGLPFHEWLIEFEQEPENLSLFAQDLDAEMRKQNMYYDENDRKCA